MLAALLTAAFLAVVFADHVQWLAHNPSVVVSQDLLLNGESVCWGGL